MYYEISKYFLKIIYKLNSEVLKISYYLLLLMDEVINFDVIQTPLGNYTSLESDGSRVLRLHKESRFKPELDFVSVFDELLLLDFPIRINGYSTNAKSHLFGNGYDDTVFTSKDAYLKLDELVQAFTKEKEENIDKYIANMANLKKRYVELKTNSTNYITDLSLLDEVDSSSVKSFEEDLNALFDSIPKDYANALKWKEAEEKLKLQARNECLDYLSGELWKGAIHNEVKNYFTQYDGSFCGDGFCHFGERFADFYHFENKVADYEIIKKIAKKSKNKLFERFNVTLSHNSGKISYLR